MKSKTGAVETLRNSTEDDSTAEQAAKEPKPDPATTRTRWARSLLKQDLFRGRATRPQFWWSAVIVTIASVAVIALTLPADGRLIEVSLGASSAVGYVSLPLIWVLVLLVPAIALTMRRLNDAGRGGKRELLWILLPVVGWGILIARLCEPTESDSKVAELVSPPASTE